MEGKTLGLDLAPNRMGTPQPNRTRVKEKQAGRLTSARARLPLAGAIIVMSRTNDEDSFFVQERDRLASEITSVRSPPSTLLGLGVDSVPLPRVSKNFSP